MDEHAREQERQAAGGDVDAAAAVLRERIRSGDLPRECVELAARLGHEVAARLHPELEPVGWDEDSITDVVKRARYLLDDPTLTTRIAADWLERGLDFQGLEQDDSSLIRSSIAAARAWADCPCDAHLSEGPAVRMGLIDAHPTWLAQLSWNARGKRDTPAECLWQQRRLASYLLGEA